MADARHQALEAAARYTRDLQLRYDKIIIQEREKRDRAVDLLRRSKLSLESAEELETRALGVLEELDLWRGIEERYKPKPPADPEDAAAATSSPPSPPVIKEAATPPFPSRFDIDLATDTFLSATRKVVTRAPGRNWVASEVTDVIRSDGDFKHSRWSNRDRVCKRVGGALAKLATDGEITRLAEKKPGDRGIAYKALPAP